MMRIMLSALLFTMILVKIPEKKIFFTFEVSFGMEQCNKYGNVNLQILALDNHIKNIYN